MPDLKRHGDIDYSEMIESVKSAPDRAAMVTALLNTLSVQRFAEIGVWKGELAQKILQTCPSIEAYYMIDPWRRLSNWKKPFNVDQATFEGVMNEALSRTEKYSEKRIVLRGATVKKISMIPDDSLDAIYIDGDHTLRGITIDLINAYTKVKSGGLILGDDFVPSLWQHDPAFEPTLVCPFAVYFAEAVKTKIYALPHRQFAMIKSSQKGKFEFCDATGAYSTIELSSSLSIKKFILAQGKRLRRNVKVAIARLLS